MDENDFMDLLAAQSLERLSKREVVLGEESLQKELEEIFKETVGEIKPEVQIRISRLIVKIMDEEQRIFQVGMEQGIRIQKWINSL
jgi:hypothetical protein